MVPHCLEYRKQWDVENYGERAADAIEEVILREGPDTVGAIVLEPVTAGGGYPARWLLAPRAGDMPPSTSCCISTRWSAVWAAPARGSAISNTGSSRIS